MESPDHRVRDAIARHSIDQNAELYEALRFAAIVLGQVPESAGIAPLVHAALTRARAALARVEGY